jgi:hypothetical protein
MSAAQLPSRHAIQLHLAATIPAQSKHLLFDIEIHYH